MQTESLPRPRPPLTVPLERGSNRSAERRDRPRRRPGRDVARRRRALRHGRRRGAGQGRRGAARARRAAVGGPPARRGRARHRQDAARQVPRRRDRRPVRPGPVHARSAARPTSPARRCTRPRPGAWDFRPGPVFANVVLVDEVNRASPRTQAALLEPMEERQVTVDGVTPRAARSVLHRRDAEPARHARARSRCPRASSTGSGSCSRWGCPAATRSARSSTGAGGADAAADARGGDEPGRAAAT